MYRYYNANPLGRKVNDCTVRAIALATNESWDSTYNYLSDYAQQEAVMMDNVIYIDKFLDKNFEKIYTNAKGYNMTVDDVSKRWYKGTYLITMKNHITCCIDGVIYDTFNPSDRLVWEVYQVK